MQVYTRGQKGKLQDLGLGARFELAVDAQAGAQAGAVDISCFGLDAGERLSDDRYMVFYNQLSSPGGAVALTLGAGQARFQVELRGQAGQVEHQLVACAAFEMLGGELAAVRRIEARDLAPGQAFERVASLVGTHAGEIVLACAAGAVAGAA